MFAIRSTGQGAPQLQAEDATPRRYAVEVPRWALWDLATGASVTVKLPDGGELKLQAPKGAPVTLPE